MRAKSASCNSATGLRFDTGRRPLRINVASNGDARQSCFELDLRQLFARILERLIPEKRPGTF